MNDEGAGLDEHSKAGADVQAPL